MPPPFSEGGFAPLPMPPPGRGRGQSPRSNVVILTLVLLLSLVPAGRVGAAYEQIVVKDGGVLTGLVKLAGAPPRLEPIHVNKNREVCGEAKESEALVAGADRGVRGSVILIEGGRRGKKPSGEGVGGNHQGRLVPHVAATMVGEATRRENSDPILHNTHGVHAGAAGSGGQPNGLHLAPPHAGQGIESTRKLVKP